MLGSCVIGRVRLVSSAPSSPLEQDIASARRGAHASVEGKNDTAPLTDASSALRNETLRLCHTRYGVPSMEQHTARRNLLRYLAASPLISAPSIASSIAALI